MNSRCDSGRLLLLPWLFSALALAACGEDGAGVPAPQPPGQVNRFSCPEPGVAAVTDIAALPLMRYGSVTRQVSSRDKSGGNDDGFSGNTQLYVDENGEYVVFDDYGPGCVYRIWFTAVLAWTGRLRIYVDDLETPRVDSPFVPFFLSAVEPFVHPLTDAIHESSGGYVTYIPVCYERRARITLSVPPEFFNITYRRYDLDQPVTSFSGGEDYARLFAQWRHPEEDPKAGSGFEVSSRQALLEVPAGESRSLLSATGAGAVWNLVLEVTPFDAATLSSLWLSATWDGHPRPDVEAPLNEFFGSLLPGRGGRGLLAGCREGRCRCRFPMPFWGEAEVRLENRGDHGVTAALDLDLLEEPYPSASGYFTTEYRREDPTTLGRDYRFARVSGAGHYVGVTYTMTGPVEGTYMEGDERFRVDGSRSPALHGTGTEDYFNGGWYFFLGAFSNPLYGSPFRLQRVGPRSRTGCYRIHLGDLVPFFGEADLGIEHDADNGDVRDSHSSVAYLYRRPESLLAASDELDLSDPESRTAHAYKAVGAEETGEITSGFEGEEDGLEVTDRGFRVRTSSEFTLSVHPENAGVLLRRRFDQGHGRQTADVYVDGVFVGTWYDVFENPVRRWAESDLPLAASLTAGKDRLRVRIVNRGSVPWSEFSYRALCPLRP